MAAFYAFWKRLSHVRKDGVNYDIGVKQRDDGRFSVSWVCLNCFEQGPPSPAAASLEQAVEFAQLGLEAHHSLVHANHVRHDGDLATYSQRVGTNKAEKKGSPPRGRLPR